MRGAPDHIATLTPAVEGHVHELLVAQGDVVKKGQPIVELDTAVTRADIEEKTATRDGLKASLALLKSIPRPEERRATELTIEQAKLAVAQAKEAADRLRPLLARREVSEQQMFIAEKARAGCHPAANGRGPVEGDDDRPAARGRGRGRRQDQDGRRACRLLEGPSRLPHHPHRSTACSIVSIATPAKRLRSAHPSARLSIPGRSLHPSGCLRGQRRR